MTVTTEAARQEVVLRRLEVDGTPRASVPVTRLDQLADIHGYFEADRPLDAISVSGLGDAAYSETRLTTNYHDVAVLSGPTLVDLSLVGLQVPDPARGLTILVRDAMARAD